VTAKQRSQRKALIIKRVRALQDIEPPAHPPEVGEAGADVEALEVPDDAFEQRARAGAAWTARHCGLVGDMG
jgi:hypothetical protein